MLSDEEMKAIDYLQLCYDLSTITNESLSKLGIALNLIEKQSKEIEELKENNKNLEDELNKYIVKMSDEQYRRLVDIIRDEINKLWEDKIKAKIEKIDKVLNEDIYAIDGHYDDRYYRYLQDKHILQSLLEKE